MRRTARTPRFADPADAALYADLRRLSGTDRFAEGDAGLAPMDRAQMLRILGRHGLDTTVLERCPPEALAEVLRAVSGVIEHERQGVREANERAAADAGKTAWW
jgi:hypothetical protein